MVNGSPSAGVNSYEAITSLSVIFNNFTASLQVDTFNFESGSNYEISCDIEASVGNSWGAVLGSDTDSIAFFYEDSSPVDETEDLSGTITFSLPVEEFFYVEDISEADSDGFPNYNGTAVKDGPKGRVIKFVEKAEIGATATVTLSLGSLSCTSSETIATDGLISHEITVGMRTDCNNTGTAITLNSDATLTVDFGEDDISAPHSVSDADNSVDFNNGIEIETDKTGGGSNYTSGSLTVHAVRRYGLKGRQRQLTTGLSPEIDWEIQHKAGTSVVTSSESYSWTQERYNASANFNGSPQTGLSLNEQTPVWVSLDPTSLGASDEDDRDWRCLIKGYLWDCFDVTHSDETLTNTTSEWTAGANTTVSAGVALAVSGGTGEATYAPPSNVDSEGYRYLEITLSSTDPSQPFTVEIGSKTWDKTTGTGSTVVRVDLCLPHNAMSTTDGKDSRFPLDAPATGDPTDSDYWGVSDIDEIVLSGLVDGQTYTVTKIELVSDSRIEVSLLSAFNNWSEAWTNGSIDVTYHKPFFWGNADGRFADLPDMFFVDLTAPGDYYSWQSLDQLKGTVGNLGGWGMANGTHALPSDGYHTRDRDAYWLGGAGATYNYTTDTWTDWIDRSASTTLVVPAQPGWDYVEVYGGAGNVWTGAASYPTTAENTPLAVCKILRARGWGLAIDEDNAAESGATVDLVQVSDGSNRGSDTSEADGYYHTGTPFGFGNLSHTIESGSRSVAITTANRMLHRAVLMVAVESGGLAYVNHRDGMHYRSYINGDGKIVSERSDNLLSWSGETTTIDADWLYLSHSYEGYPQVYLIYTDGGVVYRRSSPDGVTWGMPTTISTGASNEASAQADLPGGRSFAYWIDSTGAIKGTEYDNAGNTVGTTAFSTSITGVDSVSFFARWNDYGQGRGRVVIQCTVSGVVTQYTSGDGRTFS